MNRLYRGAKILFLAATLLCVSVFPLFVAPYNEAYASPCGCQLEARPGFPMVTWGTNARGQLGHGHYGPASAPYSNSRPRTHIGDAPQYVDVATARRDWVQTATSVEGGFAITTRGHLYVWGNHWMHPQMARNGVMPPTEKLMHEFCVHEQDYAYTNILTPVRVTYPERQWVKVAARGARSAAITCCGDIYQWGASPASPADIPPPPTRVDRPSGSRWVFLEVGNTVSHAITDEGFLYAWGSGTDGRLGLGAVTSTGGIGPQRVGGASPRNDWVQVSSGMNFSVARTAGGQLFSWGYGGQGRLGCGLGVNAPNRTTPQPVVAGISSVTGSQTITFKDVSLANATAAALSTAGHLYTWGAPGHDANLPGATPPNFGALANGYLHATGDQSTPTRRVQLNPAVHAISPQQVDADGYRNDWVQLIGATNNFNAFTSNGVLHAWGRNNVGQLGLGDAGTGTNRSLPEPVIRTVGRAAVAQGGGNHNSLLFLTCLCVPLIKSLQVPTGMPVPDLTFEFEFERVSVQWPLSASPTPYTQLSVPMPYIGTGPTAPNNRRGINVNPNSPTVTGAATTISGFFEARGQLGALRGIELNQPGRHVWIVREVQGSSGNLDVQYSPAEFYLVVYVRQGTDLDGTYFYVRDGEMFAITRVPDREGQAVGVKVDPWLFTNIYDLYLPTPTGLIIGNVPIYWIVLPIAGLVAAMLLSKRGRHKEESMHQTEDSKRRY